MEGEAIMICVDTSSWMGSNESTRFKDQVDAIHLYCTEKFKSHPETVVGTCGMSDRCMTHLCHPTREIGRIIRSLYYGKISGQLLLVEAVADAYDVWFGCSGKELGVHLPKRIVVFAGGPVYDEMHEVQILGEVLKEKNLACDAICFGDPDCNKKELFDTLIDVADNNGNCNLLHVPPESFVCDALSRSQSIRTGSTPLAGLPVQQQSSKQNINALPRSHIMRSGSTPFASLWVQQESPKLNKKAAANYPESVDPRYHLAKINALSQSVVDLALENVKPETFDESIERAKPELESLNMQKDKQAAC